MALIMSPFLAYHFGAHSVSIWAPSRAWSKYLYSFVLVGIPFYLTKKRGEERARGGFFYIYYTSSFFPSVNFLQFFPYLMPFFSGFGESG